LFPLKIDPYTKTSKGLLLTRIFINEINMLENNLDSKISFPTQLKAITFNGDTIKLKNTKISKPSPQKILFPYHNTFRKPKYLKPISQNQSLEIEGSLNNSICNPKSILNSSFLQEGFKFQESTKKKDPRKIILPSFSKPCAIAPLHIKNMQEDVSLPKTLDLSFKKFPDSSRITKSGSQLRRKKERVSKLDSYDFLTSIPSLSAKLPNAKQDKAIKKISEHPKSDFLNKNDISSSFEHFKPFDYQHLVKQKPGKKKVPIIKLEKILSKKNDSDSDDEELLLDTISSKRKIENTRRFMEIKNVNVSLQLNPEDSLETSRLIDDNPPGFRGVGKYFKPGPYRIISFRQLNREKLSKSTIGNDDIRGQLKSIEKILSTPFRYEDSLRPADSDYYY
jgi:hypothetical protein